jgi:hypothetical protein
MTKPDSYFAAPTHGSAGVGRFGRVAGLLVLHAVNGEFKAAVGDEARMVTPDAGGHFGKNVLGIAA